VYYAYHPIFYSVIIISSAYYGHLVRERMRYSQLWVSRIKFTLSLIVMEIIFVTHGAYHLVSLFVLNANLPSGLKADVPNALLFFFWEILPTAVVLILFWQIPEECKETPDDIRDIFINSAPHSSQDDYDNQIQITGRQSVAPLQFPFAKSRASHKEESPVSLFPASGDTFDGFGSFAYSSYREGNPSSTVDIM